MNYYIDVLKKYAVFDGRASRKEYWMFVLINAIILEIFWVIGTVIHGLVVLYWLYLLITLLPALVVGVRRLHDINHSGWWSLLWLIPFVGTIALVVFMTVRGDPGDNQFGPSPIKATVNTVSNKSVDSRSEEQKEIDREIDEKSSLL